MDFELPTKAELQLQLEVSPEKRAKGAIGPRASSMFRKLAVQRLEIDEPIESVAGFSVDTRRIVGPREITIHSTLGPRGMMLLGNVHADSQNRS